MTMPIGQAWLTVGQTGKSIEELGDIVSDEIVLIMSQHLHCGLPPYEIPLHRNYTTMCSQHLGQLFCKSIDNELHVALLA